MPTQEHDSWLSALGVDFDKARDWASQKADQVKDEVNKAENWVKDEAQKGADWVKTEAANVAGEVKRGAEWIKGEANKAADAVQKGTNAIKMKVVGDQSGKPVPRQMEGDCKPEHGYVPGPKNHLLCATHGHVVDTDKKMIIASSVAFYSKDGVVAAVSGAVSKAEGTAQKAAAAAPSLAGDLGVNISSLRRAAGGAAPPAVQAAGGAGQTPQSGASLVNDPQFERLIEAMEEDGEEADSTWKAQVDDGVFNFLAPEIRTQYIADGTDCDKARGDFNLEWNKIVVGKGDPKQLLAAYDIYSLRIGVLQRANERLEALIAIDFANAIAPLLAFVMKVKKFQLAERFKKQLEKLLADLDKAETAVTKAEVKTALNIAVSVITTIVAPEATLAKVLLAGGGITAHIVIDRSLGEGTVTGTVVFVGGDSGEFVELSAKGKEAIEKLKGGSKSIGAAGAAITAVLDVRDVYEGKELVEKIKVEIEDTQKGFDELMAGVLPLREDFIVLDRLIRTLPEVVNKAIAAGNDAAKNYDAIKQEIQKAIQEGS